MDNEVTKVYTDISTTEPSTREKCITWALIVFVPITAGVVATVLKNTTLGMGVMWLVAGLILLTLITYKWNWFKKYVRHYSEHSARTLYSILTVLFIVVGMVWVIMGALSY